MGDNISRCPCGDDDDADLVTKDDITGMHKHAAAVEGKVAVNDHAATGRNYKMHGEFKLKLHHINRWWT